MEEGIVTDPREADVGSILAFGFAPYHRRRAVLHRRHRRGGIRRASPSACRRNTAPQFKAPKLLVDMAAKGETFYERFDPYAGQAKKAA